MSDLEIIKEIENIIGKELKRCPSDKNIMEQGEKCSYRLNKKQQVIGLNLISCRIKNIDFLNNLKNISQLNLWNNQFSNISVLKHLTNISELNLVNNYISDISALKYLKKLAWLNLRANQSNTSGRAGGLKV